MNPVPMIIYYTITAYTILIFVRIAGSWIPELQRYRFMHFVAFYVDPYLNFFRRIIPPLGMIDLSPLLALFALQLLKHILIQVLS